MPGEQIILYVDKIEKGGFVNYTNDPATIRFNCNIINKAHMGTISESLLDSDGVTAWFPAGKYLTSVSINLIGKEYTMLFFDLQNKKEAYEKFLDGFAFSHQPPEIIEDAKKAIEMLKLTYQGRQDEFKLVVGSHIE